MKGFGDQMLQKENRHKGILAAAAAVLVLILCGCQGGGAASSEPEVFFYRGKPSQVAGDRSAAGRD